MQLEWVGDFRFKPCHFEDRVINHPYMQKITVFPFHMVNHIHLNPCLEHKVFLQGSYVNSETLWGLPPLLTFQTLAQLVIMISIKYAAKHKPQVSALNQAAVLLCNH